MTVAKKTAAKPVAAKRAPARPSTAITNPPPEPAAVSLARSLDAFSSPSQAPTAAFQEPSGESTHDATPEPSDFGIELLTDVESSVEDSGPLDSMERDTNSFLIHFVCDGMSAFGYSWSAGQELELDKDSSDFAETLDRNGNSWMTMSDDEQTAAFGRVRHRPGPSPITNPILNYEVNVLDTPVANRTSADQTRFGNLYFSEKSLKAAAKDEQERGRGVPKRLPLTV